MTLIGKHKFITITVFEGFAILFKENNVQTDMI